MLLEILHCNVGGVIGETESHFGWNNYKPGCRVKAEEQKSKMAIYTEHPILAKMAWEAWVYNLKITNFASCTKFVFFLM